MLNIKLKQLGYDVIENFDLSKISTIKVGGIAKTFIKIHNVSLYVSSRS